MRHDDLLAHALLYAGLALCAGHHPAAALLYAGLAWLCLRTWLEQDE